MSLDASVDADGGLPGPIGETFGAFEPRFYGISVLLKTPLMFQTWISKIFPDPSVPTLPLFEDTCLKTAVEHETRHFHDALISPFANRILMLRMMAAFNGLKALNRGSKLGANCIPLPLTNWMAKSQDERAAWLAEVSNDRPLGPAVPLHALPLPYLDKSTRHSAPGLFRVNEGGVEAELHAFAEVAIGAYEKASNLMRGPGRLIRSAALQSYTEDAKRELEATLSPRNVFEASALAVQLQVAWTNIGEAAADVFLEHLMASGLGYAKAFRLIVTRSAPRDDPQLVDPYRVSAVAVWCLLGDQQMPDQSNPVVRLACLLRLFDAQGGISATDSIADLWDSWDQRLELKSWRTGVRDMRERTSRSVASYASAGEDPDEPIAAQFVSVLKTYLADQRRATDLLLNDPNNYVHTLRYVERDEDDLPIPLISVELGEDFVAPLDKFPTNDAIRCLRIVDKDGVRGWNRVVLDMHKPARPRLLDAALELEFRCKMSDVVFSNEALSPMDQEVFVKSVAEAIGMVPLFIF